MEEDHLDTQPGTQNQQNNDIDNRSIVEKALFSTEEQATFLKVIKEFAANPELWDHYVQIKTSISNTAKLMIKSRKRKLREQDKEKINSAQINKRRMTTIENDRLLEEGTHRTLLIAPEVDQIKTNAFVSESSIIDVSSPPSEPVQVLKSIKCYICKNLYTSLHFFYHQMCPDCAQFNWTKRNQQFDLTGRIAVVTGGRIKIGYETALKLLRCGAKVIVTTRFPKDAALRFARETDFENWKLNLDIFGLDMRHLRSVEEFCQYLNKKYTKLDIIINNAAMTIRRPPAFYKHMIPTEETPFTQLPPIIQPVLAKQDEVERLYSKGITSSDFDFGDIKLLEEETQDCSSQINNKFIPALATSAALSQVPILKDDITDRDNELFPRGHFDEHRQQMDYRDKNSWTLELEEVQTPELLEVLAINAVSPFILNSKLKPLLDKSEFKDRHIINVSAMEGKFSFAGKTTKHPHTNCAKASLNMMTRTAAPHYLKSGIYMNAVETGWITENLPNPEEDRIRNESGYSSRIPLDEIDGAARVLDPIFTVMAKGNIEVGKFWKNYVIVDW